MKKVELWPPPNWPEVVVLWSTMLHSKSHQPNDIVKWVDSQPGGHYHLHGYKATEGFAFRFERNEDAMLFALRWL
jgi:hypothetical protein